jgi:hypothetical protein
MWFMNQMVQDQTVKGRIDVDVRARSAASTERVWNLLATTSSWTTWSKASEASLERPGDPAEGVGAIRRFKTGRTRSREEVVVYEPTRRFAYVLLEGLPLRHYRGEVELEPDGDGTRIRWHSTFDVKVPGTGWLWRAILRRFLQETADRLARGAEQS